MHRRFIWLWALCCSLLAIHAAQPGSYVTVQGRQIAGPDKKPLVLRGINLGNWLVPEGYMFRFKTATSPRLVQNVVAELIGPEEARAFWTKFQDRYITRDDIQFIQKCGFNSVRVPFNYRLFFSEDRPEVSSNRGFELLDRVVGWCREAGLWVILDLHCAPGGQTGDNIDDSWGYPWLFESEPDQERTCALWKKIAEHYRDEPTILGYDLLNEPIAHFFDVKTLNPLLEPLYKRMTRSIREADPHHLIILEGAQWASKFDMFGPPFDSKLVYSFHKYWTAATEEVIREYVAFSAKHNVPLFMGESGENTDEWIGQFRETLEKNQIGWCFWPYKKVDATSCPVRVRKPKHYDEVIDYANKPRGTFEEIRKARAEAPHAKAALDGLLENCQFQNNGINPGYLKALGMSNPN